jgi:hypothetical protein
VGIDVVPTVDPGAIVRSIVAFMSTQALAHLEQWKQKNNEMLDRRKVDVNGDMITVSCFFTLFIFSKSRPSAFPLATRSPSWIRIRSLTGHFFFPRIAVDIYERRQEL